MSSIQRFLNDSPVARLDMELLLAFVLMQDRTFILAHSEYKLSPAQSIKLRKLIARRKKGEPIAYILEEKEFFGRNFFVSRATLIPRPETEMLVEEAITTIKKHLRTKKKKKIAVIDIGTGSGAIIVSIVKELDARSKDISFFAIDNSLRALRGAKKNAAQYAIRNISFAKGDLLTPLRKKLHGFHEIVLLANLPYLSKKLYKEAPVNVRKFEPKNALVGGKDGLDHYRRLFVQIKRLSLPGKVTFFLEISPEQAEIPFHFLPSGFRIHPDLAGKPRLIVGSL